jgi:hypothetical protein
VTTILSPRSIPEHVVVGDDPVVLERLRDSFVNLAVWRRRPPTDPDWRRSAPQRLDLSGPVEVVAGRLPGGAAASGAGTFRSAGTGIGADIRNLLRVYADLTGVRRVHLRFDRVGEQTCPKFHVDALGTRLICTYRGPGTEWIEDRAVYRGALAVDGRGNADIVVDPAAIHRLRPWDVALLLGGRSGGQRIGIVHRSPPVSPGQERWLLRIDPWLPSPRSPLPGRR